MICLRELTKRYGRQTAVDALTVAIAPGKVTGFLGPNGAGKSTTMRMILGLDAPTSGTATVDGRPYRAMRHPLRRVGALLDATALHPRRSARQHLEAMARSNGIARSRVPYVLERVGLTEVADRKAGTFSLGMGQRLGIAGALLGDPATVMFDEPVNGLDPDGVLWVRQLMRSLADEGRTVFVSSHLMSEMQLVADQLVVIGRGRLITDAPAADVIARSAMADVLVRVPARSDRARLRQALRRAGANVAVMGDELVVSSSTAEQTGALAHELGIRLALLQPRPVSLEQAYMELTESSREYTATGVV